MKFFALLLAFISIGYAVGHMQAGCFKLKCQRGEPLSCPAGYTYAGYSRCGTMWTAKKTKCCPSGQSPPLGPQGPPQGPMGPSDY